MAETSSPNNLGKKPRWYLTDDELLRIPSRMGGMDATQELKCRREAAGFIQEMAERLNQNVPNHRGRINQNCIGIAMVHMHRFFIVHSFRIFEPKDVAAACLFLAGKSEECPRKLEHIVEVWFKLKHRKAEVQPPFNETVKKNGADLIALLEGILLQTIGFELQVDLPHPIVVKNMQNFKLANPKLVDCAYWFASDIIQLTNWCIRYNEKTIACVCIYLACSWADYEIPETACSPWFKAIDAEMTQEQLDKLTDEFTLMYKNCSDCHARRFIQKAKNGNPATMPVKAIAKLPPPPTPPVFQQATKRMEDGEQAETATAEQANPATGEQTKPAIAENEQKVNKRQSFFPDFSKASSYLGSDSLELPIGIPLVEKEKTRKREHPDNNRAQHQLQKQIKQQPVASLDERYATTSADRSQLHPINQEKHNDRSHEHRKESREKHHNQHDGNRISEETKKILNGVSTANRDCRTHRGSRERSDSNGNFAKEQHRHRNQHQSQTISLPHAIPPKASSAFEQKSIGSSPMTPTPPPPSTVCANELEEGEVL